MPKSDVEEEEEDDEEEEEGYDEEGIDRGDIIVDGEDKRGG
jgi:hypothetical protein